MLEQATKTNQIIELPAIPDKRYFTIGEVSKLCVIKPHVLRYWEQEFKQLNPSKRRGNRRYYQQKDLLMIREIRRLLYDEGFTISGARQQLIVARPPEKNIPTLQEFFKSSIKELEHLISFLENDQQIVGA